MSEFLKCECTHCGQPIEYPLEGTGTEAPCPACGKPVMLFSRSQISEFNSNMAKSKCPRCFGGIEFLKNGIGHLVKCPHCGRTIQLSLNPFARGFVPAAVTTDVGIRVSKCDPAPTALPQKRALGVLLRKLTEKTIKARTKTGDTPLHRAAKNGKIQEIPQHLLQTELFTLKNNRGQTPLDLAARHGHFDKVPRQFLTKETVGRVLHALVICGHAEHIPKEFLKPEFLSITDGGETVLHALARVDRLDLVPEIYANSEIWNSRDSSGRTPRDLHQVYLEWKILKERKRAETATEKQKEKLRYFGCVFDENITKGQASDALDKCAIDFPEVDQAYYNRTATEEQLARLRKINAECEADDPFYDFEEGPPTYGRAKDLLQDWDFYLREKEREEMLAYWDSEEGKFDQACEEFECDWAFEDRPPTRKQIAKVWELAKFRKSNKTQLPTHNEIVAVLIELFPEFKRC
jgi:endogenous inhibitor of DNA gyrase (YacG/DUF329 family)